MFEPNYRITNTITNHLTEITEARTVILNAPIVPKWEINLRKEALLKSTHASTSIEGNPLSLEEVSQLRAGRDITAKRRDKQEVLNYFDALAQLDNLTVKSQPELEEANIFRLHRIITKDVLDDPKKSGAYRKGRDYVFVGNPVTRAVTFMPPPTKEVPGLMRCLISWLNNTETKKINPVIEAGITHYEFVRIHPFLDGNGRTARALATLVLIRRGFDTKRFFALDDYYNSDRERYYNALKTVDPKTRDLTEWLEYFCEGVNVSIQAVERKVRLISGEKRAVGKQVSIDDRQIRIVEYLNGHGRIANKDVREMLGVSNKTAFKLLADLIQNEVIKRVGEGRGVFYTLRQ